MAIDKNSVEHIEGLGPSDLLEGPQGDRRMRISVDDISKDSFGQLLTAEYTALVERKPFPGLSLQRDLVDPVSGNVTVTNGQLVIDGTAETTTVYTTEFGRYIPGLFGLLGVGYELPTPETGTYEFGYGDDSGNRIGMNVTSGTYSTFVESGGVRYYSKNRSDWLDPLDGTGPSGLDVDISRATFRAELGWYGTIPPKFYLVISTRDIGTKKILIDRGEQPSSGFVIEQPDLPIFCEATGGVLNVGGRQFGVLGRYTPNYRVTGGIGAKSSVGTTFVPLCSFRVKSAAEFQGVPVKISGVDLITLNDADMAIVIGGTLTGDAFGNVEGVDPTETALEFDNTATAISGGYLTAPSVAAGGVGASLEGSNPSIPDLQIPQDQIVTLVTRAASGTSDMRGALRLLEEW